MPRFVVSDVAAATYLVHEGWEFRPWKKLKWLESKVSRLWIKLASPVMVPHRSFMEIDISAESLTELILKHSEHLRHERDLIAKHVVIGRKQAFELDHEVHGRALSFHHEMDVVSPGGVRKVHGVDVHVVPWFDGVLLLPEWEDLR